jgi:hypothetical protein
MTGFGIGKNRAKRSPPVGKSVAQYCVHTSYNCNFFFDVQRTATASIGSVDVRWKGPFPVIEIADTVGQHVAGRRACFLLCVRARFYSVTTPAVNQLF